MMSKTQTIHVPAEKQVDIVLNNSPSATFYEINSNSNASNIRTVTSDSTILPSGNAREIAVTSDYGVELSITSPVSANSVVLTNSASDVAANADTTYTFDFRDGAHQKVTVSSDCTFAFNFPANQAASFVLEVVNGGASTITWPASVEWAGGSEATLTTSGTDIMTIYQAPDNTVYANVVQADVSAPA